MNRASNCLQAMFVFRAIELLSEDKLSFYGKNINLLRIISCECYYVLLRSSTIVNIIYFSIHLEHRRLQMDLEKVNQV